MKQGICIFGSSEATQYRDNRGAEGWSCVPRVPSACACAESPACPVLPWQCPGPEVVPQSRPGSCFPSVACLCSQMPTTPRYLTFVQSGVSVQSPPLCGGYTEVTNAWDFREFWELPDTSHQAWCKNLWSRWSEASYSKVLCKYMCAHSVVSNSLWLP